MVLRTNRKLTPAALSVTLASRVILCAASSHTDFFPTEGPGVRFTSAQTVYVETLNKGQWSSKYWSADGRINVPTEGRPSAAFLLEVDHQPVTNDWSGGTASELPPTSRGARHIIVTLTNQPRALEVVTHTLLDGTPVLTRYLEIRNNANRPVALTACYPWTSRLWPRPPADFDLPLAFSLGYFTNQSWAAEGWFTWHKLPLGTRTVVSDQARSHDDPFFVVRNDAIGEYFIGHLAWSANWKMEFTREERSLLFHLGPASETALRVIAPGETVTTPAVHLGYVLGDFDTAVQSMHAHLRRSVLPHPPKDRSYLIQYVVPADQGYYMPFNEDVAFKCVDVAAAIGAELFILDYGWWDVTCDWSPSPTRFPHGLNPLIDYVHKKGMLFGLYFETEGGRGNVSESKVAHEHPDWIGPSATLNLQIPAAAAWVESEIRRMLTETRMDLYRLDYNPSFQFGSTTRESIQENNCWRYYEAFYGMYERIRASFPRVLLQQAAAGGARNDLGTASRFHEQYLTDGLNIPREFLVYSGETLAMPPEVFVILHGADGLGGGLGKPQNLDTVLRLSFSLGTPQIFLGTVAPSVQELSPERRARFLHYVRIYKDFIRPLWPTVKMFHHEPVNARGGIGSSGWFAMEFGAPDRRQGWAMIARIGNSDNDTYSFKPRGLDPARTYSVTLDGLDSTLTTTGLSLMREGLPIRLEAIAESELLLFKETTRH